MLTYLYNRKTKFLIVSKVKFENESTSGYMNIDDLEHSLQKLESIIKADFIEIRYDDLQLRTLEKENENWREIQSKRRKGIAVTTYLKGAMGFSSTAILTEDSILEAGLRSFKVCQVSAENSSLDLSFAKEKPVTGVFKINYVKKHPKDVALSDKTDLIERGMSIAKESGGDEVSNVRGLYGELYGDKFFVNSEGSKLQHDFLITDLQYPQKVSMDLSQVLMVLVVPMVSKFLIMGILQSL